MVQPTTFKIKSLRTDDVNTIADVSSCISAGDLAPLSHTDDPGGDIDDPGGGSTNDLGSFSDITTSASTFSTTRVSLLKSAVDVVKCTDVDGATGPFLLFMLHSTTHSRWSLV